MTEKILVIFVSVNIKIYSFCDLSDDSNKDVRILKI